MKRGRPNSVIFSADDEKKLAKLYLDSNKDRHGGSATMAARVFAGSHPELAAALAGRASKHDLPEAVRRAVAPAKHLVKLHREGERGLCASSAYNPGRMRLAPDGDRRLFAGEQICADDGTVNFGVCVPWPWGGCRCSDRYGVKLGRFQLLLIHDDATSLIPCWSYVIKASQGYTAVDVTGLLLRFCRDVGIPLRALFEGGSWQSLRVLAALAAMGIELVDVKGRPREKLVENFFNRFWTRLSIETKGQVGRSRNDDPVGQKLYCAGQRGDEDPRGYFPMLAEALEAIEISIKWENAERIESKLYGHWTPAERWAIDRAAHPFVRLDAQSEHFWLAAPVLEERIVRRGMIEVTTDGPLGMKTLFHFTGPDLWDLDRRRVRIAFDPLTAPCVATVADADSARVLCTAQCIDPWAMDTDEASAQVNALRAVKRHEYRCLTVGESGAQRLAVSETQVRGVDRVLEIRSGSGAVAPESAVHGLDGLNGRDGQETSPAAASPLPRATGADLSRSLSRRAAKAAQTSDAAW